MPRALVTGGAGFIGSHVARHLVHLGWDVVVLDDLTGGQLGQVPRGARFVEGSVLDADRLGPLFARERFDYVYHLAAYAAEGLSHFIRRYNYETNVIGSMNLVNLSVHHEVKGFVFTSSIAVYGANQLPMSEDLVPRPEDPYGIAKYAVELDLAAAHRQFGLPYVCFRPHNVYGEHQNIGDKYRNVIGIFMRQILDGQPMTLFGDGSQTRAFSYIDDVAPVIARAVLNERAWGNTFNIGGGVVSSVKEVALAVAEAMGVAADLRYLAPRREVQHAYASHARLNRVFPLPAPTSLPVGLGRMAAWARAVEHRKPSEFGAIEIRRGLPDGW